MSDHQRANGSLSYQAVGFSYPESAPALVAVDLEIAAGEVTLVDPSRQVV